MCLACVVFGGLISGGPLILVFQTVLNFMLLLNVLTVKTCAALKVKKFKFWRSPFGGNPQF